MNLPLFNPKYLVFQVLLVSLMAGCATVPVPEPSAGGFVLRGKLGVVDGSQSVSARFLWQQQAGAFTIDLWGPLGQGRVRLTGHDTVLELRHGDGTVIDRGAPAAVMRRHLGWSLPLDVLPQWVRGQPAPGLPVTERRRDQAGHLLGFHQLGWTVELERYRSVAAAGGVQPVAGPAGQGAPVLPHRVTASRDAYRVRLAISDWEI